MLSIPLQHVLPCWSRRRWSSQLALETIPLHFVLTQKIFKLSCSVVDQLCSASCARIFPLDASFSSGDPLLRYCVHHLKHCVSEHIRQQVKCLQVRYKYLEEFSVYAVVKASKVNAKHIGMCKLLLLVEDSLSADVFAPTS